MIPCALPKPHYGKLVALSQNRKLPEVDKPRVAQALERYIAWVALMDGLQAEGQDLLRALVDSINEYKRFIEVDLIYDSPADFLYRQKGQHKVDNSVLEEFLPRLADTRLVPGLSRLKSCTVGPQGAFAAFIFAGSVHTPLPDGGIFIKEKDQDYALSKQVYLRASSDPTFAGDDTLNTVLNVAYLAAECKTNLDKTMFNEGLETARALKQAVAGSRYLLLCEWLDMEPIDTSSTDIEEVIILRKAKRLGSNFREGLATAAGREAARNAFVEYYDGHPLQRECFGRIVDHMRVVYPENVQLDEQTILQRGYF
ncbi:MAG: Bpu10I family restriction endonuclease [Terriglobia bacterium]|jgi:hypothetical protein